MIEIKVPTVGESINEVTLVKWLKHDGDYVQRDEVIAELESEKATFEVNAEQAGVLKTVGNEGDTLNIGDVLATIDETAKKPGKSEGGQQKPDGNGMMNKGTNPPDRRAGNKEQGTKNSEQGVKKEEGAKNKEEDHLEVRKPVVQKPTPRSEQPVEGTLGDTVKATPVASAIITDKKINPSTISPSGIGGKILKGDVLDALTHPGRRPGIQLFNRDEKSEK